tara:strand:- start:237 stop:389 length:153 start_codon:yes stop_codon:yes gene_type:complete
LINHLLEVVDRNIGLILQDMVMNWTSGTLNGGMRAEVEVILIGVSDILLD